MLRKVKILLYKIVRRCFWVACRPLPIRKNKIVVQSYLFKGYSDNLKYIVENLLEDDVQVVWGVLGATEAKTLPKKVKPCKFNSLKFIYHLATAGVWLDNCRKDFAYKKRKQLYIQTWHGGGAQKRVEKDVVDALDAEYVRKAKKDGKYTDVMLSDSRFVTELYYRSFWFDGYVAEIGTPRNDILMQPNDEAKRKVYEFFGIDESKKILLYAPTFRKNLSFEPYDIDYSKLLPALKERFNEDFVVFVHLHPNVANKFDDLQYDNVNVFNATPYPDMQELVVSADIMISDYSSVNYEFALRRKPALRFATDIDEYMQDRALYFDIREYPFPLSENNAELQDLVLHFDENDYLEALEAFFKKIGAVQRPDSAEWCARFILDYMALKGDKRALFESYKGQLLTKESVEK